MVQFEPHHLSVQLWTSLPASVGNFFLGESALGGTDVLGGFSEDVNGYGYQDFSTYVTEINIENSVNLTNVQDNGGGIECEIILTGKSDPLAGMHFRVGSGVQIGLKNYVPGQPFRSFFNGTMKQLTTQVDSDGVFRTQIIASDLREIAFNQIIENYDDGLVEPITLATRCANIKTALTQRRPYDGYYGLYPFNANTFLVDSTTARFPAAAQTDASLGDLITKTANGDGAWLVSQFGLDGTTDANLPAVTLVNKNLIKYRLNNPDNNYDPVVILADDGTDSHVDITAINRETDTTQIINNIKVTLEQDALTSATYIDSDSIDLFGQNSIELALDVFDQTDLDNYVAYAGTATARPKIKSVSIDAISHKNRHLHDVWKLYPSAPVQVQINQPDFAINERYLVTRVAHRITPETWETELELWRTN